MRSYVMKRNILFFNCLFIFLFSTTAAFTAEPVHEDLGYVIFMPDKSTFANPSNAAKVFDQIADTLKTRETENARLLISGYTADVDNGVDEWKLSKDRAKQVVSELEKRGINASLFASDGYGSTYKWGDNTTESQRRPNRRVTVIFEQIIQNDEPAVLTPPVPFHADEPPAPEPVSTPPVSSTRASVIQQPEQKGSFPLWIIFIIVVFIVIIALIVIIIRALTPPKAKDFDGGSSSGFQYGYSKNITQTGEASSMYSSRISPYSSTGGTDYTDKIGATVDDTLTAEQYRNTESDENSDIKT